MSSKLRQVIQMVKLVAKSRAAVTGNCQSLFQEASAETPVKVSMALIFYKLKSNYYYEKITMPYDHFSHYSNCFSICDNYKN